MYFLFLSSFLQEKELVVPFVFQVMFSLAMGLNAAISLNGLTEPHSYTMEAMEQCKLNQAVSVHSFLWPTWRTTSATMWGTLLARPLVRSPHPTRPTHLKPPPPLRQQQQQLFQQNLKVCKIHIVFCKRGTNRSHTRLFLGLIDFHWALSTKNRSCLIFWGLTC